MRSRRVLRRLAWPWAIGLAMALGLVGAANDWLSRLPRRTNEEQQLPAAIEGGFSLRGAKVHARLTSRGVEVDGWRLDFGEGNESLPQAVGRRVEYRRAGGVVEWYEANPHGVEQGFDVFHRPEGNLVLSGRVEGEGEVAKLGEGLAFGQLQYTHLAARDARGRPLRAHMEWDLPSRTLSLRLEAAELAWADFPVTIDPLLSTSSWSVDPADQVGAQFGRFVAGAGDVNGDGFGDVVVSAHSWDGEAADEGRAYLYLGSTTGLSSVPSWVQDPADQPFATFGYSIAAAGDVNGDGYADVLVGAPYWDGEAAGEGRAFLYLGTATGLSATPGWTADPTDQISAYFGFSVAGAGDVNGDGFADVVVGAREWNGEAVDEGRAYLYLGSATGLSSTPAWTADPTDQGIAGFGDTIAGAGDVNGDGFGDVLVGAWRWDGAFTDEGRAYLYLGNATGLSSTPAWMADPADQPSANFGDTVAGLGDVNGDGFGDVVVAGVVWGRAVLYLGNATGLASTPAWMASPNPTFGESVAGAGDVNGDGFADVVISAHTYGGGEGRGYLYLGSAAGLSPTPAWVADPTDQGGANFSSSIAGAGDVDGDGFGDVIVGARNWDGQATDEGSAYLFRGTATGLSLTPAWTADPTDQAGARFGFSVAGTGDVNGDGFTDVVVGAYGWSGQGAAEGRAYLYQASASGLISTPAWTANPAGPDDAYFGSSVAKAGDVNGDGFGDVVVGAPNRDAEATWEGSAYVYLGSVDGLAPTPAWTADPTDQANAHFGYRVAGAGDVNGDGHADVLVTSIFWDGEATDEGRAYLYLGGATGLSSTPAWTADPTDQANAEFGESVAGTGDINGDGYADVVVGADDWSGEATNEGRAYVYLGSAAGLSATATWMADPTDQVGGDFGHCVAAAGDVNGDGFGDILVGARSWDGQATDEGRAFLYLGSAAGLSALPAWTDDPTDQANAEFGCPLASAGDVNGDGLGDVVVGAPRWDGQVANEGRAYVYFGNANGLSSTPAWTVDPTDQADARFAISVAGAGDVNADGFGDVLVGADGWDELGAQEGRAFLFLGGDNELPGLDRGLHQFQADGTTRLGVGGTVSGATVIVQGRASPVWSIAGRLRLEVEAKRVGTAFDGAGTVRSALVVGGQVATVALSGLLPGAGYRWRARVMNPVGTHFGRWVSFGGNSEAEPDFVTPASGTTVDGGRAPLHLRVGCGCTAPPGQGLMLSFVVTMLLWCSTRRPSRGGRARAGQERSAVADVR